MLSGFIGFSLIEHDKIPDKYIVVRPDGSPAKELSEGERNFIAFLYFYYLVHGAWKRDDLTKGKIVVIDDPVSSLDSSVMFIVGSLVRGLIEDCFCDGKKHNIKQIFILTHNPYFHKEISNKYEANSEELIKKSTFTIVKKTDDNVSIVETCERKNSDPDSDIEMENYTEPIAADIERLMKEPYDYIILDYAFGYLNDCVGKHIDLTVFIDTPLDVALARHIIRDYTSRSKESDFGLSDVDEVSLEALDKELRWYLTRSRPTYTKMSEMHKPVSDLIVDGMKTPDEIADIIIFNSRPLFLPQFLRGF